MATALQRESGAIILFDFASAFPSPSQEYLHDMLRHLDLPASARRLCEALVRQWQVPDCESRRDTARISLDSRRPAGMSLVPSTVRHLRGA
eukprot:8840094-Pyramimonas_sp.AAC.1